MHAAVSVAPVDGECRLLREVAGGFARDQRNEDQQDWYSQLSPDRPVIPACADGPLYELGPELLEEKGSTLQASACIFTRYKSYAVQKKLALHYVISTQSCL